MLDLGSFRRQSRRRRGGGPGQVVVEMLLILPVFLTIVFTIMEMGYLAFWVIVLNHATYEVARIGAMTSTGPEGGEPRDVTTKMQTTMSQIISQARVKAEIDYQRPLYDRQAQVYNHDLLVTGSFNVPLVFPISSILLHSPASNVGHRWIYATVRMPIERPLQK